MVQHFRANKESIGLYFFSIEKANIPEFFLPDKPGRGLGLKCTKILFLLPSIGKKRGDSFRKINKILLTHNGPRYIGEK